MPFTCISRLARSRWCHVFALCASVCITSLWLLRSTLLVFTHRALVADDDEPLFQGDGRLMLPMIYRNAESLEEASGICADRFGSGYLRTFSGSATSCCEIESGSAMTCFAHSVLGAKPDKFCLGKYAFVDSAASTLLLNCTPRKEDGFTNPLSRLPTYWYDTGPAPIFRDFVRFDKRPERAQASHNGIAGRTLLLVKREGPVDNLWHTLMQVMSLWLSLDVLAITRGVDGINPLYSRKLFTSTQVVILDSLEQGPFFELWSMFGALRPVRLSELRSSSADDIILPLSGGSNTLWQGDWVDLACNSSLLLDVFVQRMLDFYKLAKAVPERKPLRITVIDRKGKRKLHNQISLISAMHSRFPDVDLQLVDFAGLPLVAQIRLVQDTNILVGVHGAGLTHEIFLAPGSTVVEIQPPELNHKGFRNTAKFRNLHYFMDHGAKWNNSQAVNDWQQDDVFIEEDRFLELMVSAVEATLASYA